MNIIPCMLNRVFNKLTVQAMFQSLHKNYKVKSKLITIEMKKLDKRTSKYSNNLHSCIHIDMDSAIAFLEHSVKTEHNRFTEKRKEWLFMVKFAKVNYELLSRLKQSPDNKNIKLNLKNLILSSQNEILKYESVQNFVSVR